MSLLRVTLWILAVAYWVLIAVLDHIPPRKLPHTTIPDKLVHFIFFGGLSLLLCTAMCVGRRTRRFLWLVPVLCLSWAAIDELTQPAFGRTCDLFDWYADAVGTFAAFAFIWLLLQLLPARSALPGPTLPS